MQAILLSGSPTILLFPLPITTKQTLKTTNDASRTTHEPWNKGSLIGQKPPLKLREIWTVRTQLRIAGKTRELGLFNPAIDSTLRGCDLVALRVRDIADSNHVIARASVFRRKTEAREPVRFELTDQTREAVQAWIKEAALSNGNSLFPSRQSGSLHLSARVSTHASSSDGSSLWGLIRKGTGRTRCVGPRRR